jgi:hypothetical protein
MYYRSHESKVPDALRIELVVSDSHGVLHRAVILATNEPGHTVFGTLDTVVLSEVPRLEAFVFAGLVVEHELAPRTARLYLHLYDTDSHMGTQVLLAEGALEVPFEEPDDWQVAGFGENYRLDYKITPVNRVR